jgi:hypothetical protein
MASSSVSFRISRSAEDLAGTLHLLSQRLVRLEQRLEALEGQGQASSDEDPALEESLGNAERLLLDCRALLGGALDLEALPGPDDHAFAALQEDQASHGPVEALEEGLDGSEAGEAGSEMSPFANGTIESAAA